MKIAFTWEKHGQLMFKRVPFGLKIMTGHMQKHMEQLLGKLGRIPFQDSINGCRTTQKEYVRSIRSFDI